MQAKVEVNILELLRERDPEGKYNCGETREQGGGGGAARFAWEVKNRTDILSHVYACMVHTGPSHL